ncbi:MAG: xanthine dehydrogenase family protein molybdopterin-binding subunit [Butyricicoccus sp.]
MHKYAVVGESVIKKDALDKVLGRAQFAADLRFEGGLWGAVVRSPVASAYIREIDPRPALALDGVVCVLTAKDIPGRNRIGIILKDEPVLVDDKVRRIGDAVALVAAETRELAEYAATQVRVEYEELEPVFTIARALEEDSPKVHGTTNLLQKKHLIHGDVEAGFAASDVIIERDYQTSMLSHMFIEPDAGAATCVNGRVTIYSATQNPHFDRGEVAAMLDLPNSRVRSVQMTTGGGFGGKLDISVQCHTALLAWHTGRPVKMVRRRAESTMVSSKRHPITMHAKTGASKDGRLLAHEVTMLADTGAYASYGPAVITRAMVHCTGPYVIPNVRVRATFVYTNNPMAGAFRGFGVPQVAILHEGQMDALAKALGMDPIALRFRNMQHAGCETATGQVLRESVGLEECLRRAVEEADALGL